MKSALRQNVPTLILLFVLVAITSVATYQQLRRETEQPALATWSSEPDGARALFLWAEALGYAVSAETADAFGPPRDADVALILEPQMPGVSADEWRALEEWVEAGGTLFMAGEGIGAALSMQHLDFEMVYREGEEGEVAIVEQGYFSFNQEDLSSVRPRAILQSERVDHAALLTVDGDLVAAALDRGDGAIVLSTLVYPFSNLGLKDAGNPEFVLRMLRQAGDSGTIWFDEWHHGRRAASNEAPSGLGQWLRTSPPGQAIVYSGAALFVWLVLSGARFGPPIPVRRHRQRRTPAEHVVALANLSRRAGHRSAVQAYYRHELKAHLGRRYGLSPALPDAEFLRRLREADADVDEVRLKEVMEKLNQGQIGEQELLKAVQEAGQWVT